MRKIAIFGQNSDLHVTSVIKQLNAVDISTTVFNYYYREDFDLCISHDGVLLNGEDLLDFDLVWWRQLGCLDRKHQLVISFDDQLKTEFWNNQWIEAFKFLRGVSNIFQINSHNTLVENKLMQLSIAHKVGLKVPNGVVTNDPDTVEEIISGVKNLKYKELGQFYHSFSPLKKMHNLPLQEISKYRNIIKIFPGVFSEPLNKNLRIKLLIFSDHYFLIEPNEKEVVVNEIREIEMRKLREFLAEIKLDYAVFDLIIDDSMNLIFVGLEPEGSWLTGGEINRKISEAFASFLEYRALEKPT